jgi:hypothetical protein
MNRLLKLAMKRRIENEALRSAMVVMKALKKFKILKAVRLRR